MTRTVLLGVDGCLIVEIDSPERAYAADRAGIEYSPLPVPSDALTLTIPGRDGRGPYFYRPAVVDALRDLAADGVDLVWNTRWLTVPAQLDELVRELGLTDAVRRPIVTELPIPPANVRVEREPNVFWEHWKVQALVEHVRRMPADAAILVLDAHLDMASPRLRDGVAHRTHRDVLRVDGIKTDDTQGIDGKAIGMLRTWAAGSALPRVQPAHHTR